MSADAIYVNPPVLRIIAGKRHIARIAHRVLEYSIIFRNNYTVDGTVSEVLKSFVLYLVVFVLILT